MSSRLSLLLAVLALALWFGLAFVAKVEAGAVHLLLAVGMILAVRWWALAPEKN